MSLRSLGERVRRLEGRGNNADAVLEFSNGQTVAVRVVDVLGLVCDAMRRTYARNSGEALPTSRHDRTLNAFERAASISTGCEPLVEMTFDVLHSEGE